MAELNKVQHIIQGLYGISESEKMIPNESARFTLQKTIECLEKALTTSEAEIRARVIDEFAERLHELCGFEDGFYQYPFLLHESRIDEIASQMKESEKA